MSMLRKRDKLKDRFLQRQIAASSDPKSGEQSSDTNDESSWPNPNRPRDDKGATLQELGRNFASENKLSGDFDDDQTTRLFETLFRHIKYWCHENVKLNRELINDKNFEYLHQLKSEDVRVEDLLNQSRGVQYLARAFIGRWLQEAIFDMGSVKSRVTDALRVIEEEMSERELSNTVTIAGTPEKDINLWRSTTMRILDSKNRDGTEIEALENKEIREHILRWMGTNFGLADDKNDLVQMGNDLQAQVIDRASKLFLEMRKKSSSIEVRLHFEPKGKFLSEYMEDVMSRDYSEAPSRINLVVTPALLRLTGPDGERLERPKVLKKAKVAMPDPDASRNLDAIRNSHSSHPLVLVLGHTGHGKSYFIRSLLSPQEGKNIKIGGWRSCTRNCDIWEARLANKTVYMVDTPGFNDTYQSDTEILATIIRSICTCQLLGYKIRGIIYVVDITSTIGGKNLDYLAILRALCGEAAYRNVIFVTTKWKAEDTKEERQAKEERQDGFFAEALADFRGRGAGLHSYAGGPESARTIVMSLIGMYDAEFQIEKEMRDWGLKLWDTKTVQVLKEILATHPKIKPQDIKNLEHELEEKLGTTMGALRQRQESFIIRLLQEENPPSEGGSLKVLKTERAELAFRILVTVWNQSVKIVSLALSIIQAASG